MNSLKHGREIIFLTTSNNIDRSTPLKYADNNSFINTYHSPSIVK